jgi:hypothetical protein
MNRILVIGKIFSITERSKEIKKNSLIFSRERKNWSLHFLLSQKMKNLYLCVSVISV